MWRLQVLCSPIRIPTSASKISTRKASMLGSRAVLALLLLTTVSSLDLRDKKLRENTGRSCLESIVRYNGPVLYRESTCPCADIKCAHHVPRVHSRRWNDAMFFRQRDELAEIELQAGKALYEYGAYEAKGEHPPRSILHHTWALST